MRLGHSLPIVYWRYIAAQFTSPLMLYLIRFLVKLACIVLVLAFFGSIGMAWLFAHPEVKTFTQLFHTKPARN